jgi:hypothetical protein
MLKIEAMKCSADNLGTWTLTTSPNRNSRLIHTSWLKVSFAKCMHNPKVLLPCPLHVPNTNSGDSSRPNTNSRPLLINCMLAKMLSKSQMLMVRCQTRLGVRFTLQHLLDQEEVRLCSHQQTTVIPQPPPSSSSPRSPSAPSGPSRLSLVVHFCLHPRNAPSRP